MGASLAAALLGGAGSGKFKDEIVPLELPGRKGATIFDKDEHNRPQTTLEALAALRPAFRKDGTITAGNAPGVNSGAAAVVLADRNWADERGLAPVARLVSYGIAAVEPGMFGLGPIPAVRQALDRAGWRLGDVERIEINEAFAAIVIAVTRELGLSPDIVIRTPKERFDPEAQKRDEARCARVLELLDERLADRQFVGGDAFSMADIPVGASVYRWYALDIVHPSLPNLRRWYNSLTERLAFRREVMLPLS